MGDAKAPGGDADPTGRHLRLVAGREIAFDGEGFFWDYDDWSEEAAVALATEAGLPEMLAEHWRVIRFFREFYEYNGRAPLNRDNEEPWGKPQGSSFKFACPK